MDFKRMFNFSNMDDKTKGMIKMAFILIGIFVAFILFFVIYKAIFGSALSYDKIENIMVRSAKQYVNNHPEKVEGSIYGTVEIKVSDLIAEGYMKDMSKYTKKDVMCSGSVLVFKNLDDYSYSPKLDCGEAYKYKNLTDEITKEENIVTTDNGLYKIESGEPYYIFRGENVDNYLKINNTLYRIMKIDENGNIRLFSDDVEKSFPWDNRYNVEKKYDAGINEFEGTQASRIKDKILSVYNDEEKFSKDVKSLIIPQEFCIGKRTKQDIDNTGNIECSKKSELMGIGTIALYEYFQASLDPNCFSSLTKSCKNYNYLANYSKSYWTLTAAMEGTEYVYKVNKSAVQSKAATYAYLHLVLTINGNVNYIGGTGTLNDPYIVKPIV